MDKPWPPSPLGRRGQDRRWRLQRDEIVGRLQLRPVSLDRHVLGAPHPASSSSTLAASALALGALDTHRQPPSGLPVAQQSREPRVSSQSILPSESGTAAEGSISHVA